MTLTGTIRPNDCALGNGMTASVEVARKVWCLETRNIIERILGAIIVPIVKKHININGRVVYRPWLQYARRHLWQQAALVVWIVGMMKTKPLLSLTIFLNAGLNNARSAR